MPFLQFFRKHGERKKAEQAIAPFREKHGSVAGFLTSPEASRIALDLNQTQLSHLGRLKQWIGNEFARVDVVYNLGKFADTPDAKLATIRLLKGFELDESEKVRSEAKRWIETLKKN